ncbi:MAG: formate/nitrite transporter family protein, partial [Phycisphaerales bacterium JB064]
MHERCTIADEHDNPKRDPSVDHEQDTHRESQRTDEDRAYQPVILKRTDVALRHPDDTLQLAIEEGVEQADRRWLSLLLSAIGAGGTMAFTALAVGVAASATERIELDLARRALIALAYPIGFVLCLMSGTQLFTEHTALAVYPVLDKRLRARALGRLWGTVLLGNILGCLLGALLLTAAEGVTGAAPGYAWAAEHFLKPTAGATLASAVLAGWLMALGGWLVLSSPPGPASVLLIYLVTLLIGLGGLHHSIAGTAELLAARFTGAPVPLGPAAASLAIAIAGNLIGGSIFVALLNYGSIRHTRRG